MRKIRVFFLKCNRYLSKCEFFILLLIINYRCHSKNNKKENAKCL